jgi:chromosome segregation ATPase
MTGQTEPTTEQQNAFERGVKAGQVDSSLGQHEERLDKINGSMTRLADRMAGVELGIQRLVDQGAADASARLATAQALKEEREATAAALEATTNRANQKWTPRYTIAAFLGSLATATAAGVAIYVNTH